MKEIWEAITGFNGLYEISTLGRVKSLRKIKLGKNQSTYYTKERILVPCVDSDGYHFIHLCGGTKKGIKKIHRLVADAFIANPHSKPTVNHLDGVKSNNKANNLEWASNAENNNHAFAIGLKKACAPKPVCQFTISGELVAIFPSRNIASKSTGINNGNIGSAICGRYRHAGGFMWKNHNK